MPDDISNRPNAAKRGFGKGQPTVENLERDIRAGEKWLVGLGTASLLINMVIAWIYWHQLTEMRKSTDAARSAANTAADTLRQAQTNFVRDQRPYVWQAPKTTSAPMFHPAPDGSGRGQILWDWHMTNYGKTPANNVRFTQEMKLANGEYQLSHGEKSADAGNPQAPGADTFDTVISAPISKSELDQLLKQDDGISIRVHIWYSGASNDQYESSICLTRTNAGSIAYCKKDNYIK